jgi:hypothetical protein|tara:strand:- start:333 stop:488 length:156 start_codon:yes stop_codon:yes gene_type:complete
VSSTALEQKLEIYSFINTAVAEWLGGYGEGPTPDPIPNSAVKTLSADGTAS